MTSQGMPSEPAAATAALAGNNREKSPAPPPTHTGGIPHSGVSAVPLHSIDFARVERSIEALSTDLRDATRRLVTLETSETLVPEPGPPPAIELSKQFWVPVSLLLGLILALLAGLAVVIHQSHTDFGKGIEIATLGYSQGQSASAMTRRVFLLASGHQIITFKAAAFVISALMFFVGAVFVLYRANATYDLRTESSALKASLSTSSPGLVIITLSTALAIATLYAKSNVTDQADYDLGAPQAATTADPTPAASVVAPRVDRAAEEAMLRRFRETVQGLEPGATKSAEGAGQ